MRKKRLKKKFKNKYIVFFILILSILVFFLISFFFALHTNRSVITLTGTGFEPQELTIKKGQRVVFRTTRNMSFWPASNLHPTHSLYSEFDPKHSIDKDDTWSFIFNKVGEWRYHDHLRPNFTGRIVVTDEKGNLPRLGNDCQKLQNEKKKQCWDNTLQKTLEHEGLERGFELFVSLYNTDPEVPKYCHGWAHILGREAYKIYKKDKHMKLQPEVSFCGYGFFHGFIEQLLFDTGNYNHAREFCVNVSNTLTKKKTIY